MRIKKKRFLAVLIGQVLFFFIGCWCVLVLLFSPVLIETQRLPWAIAFGLLVILSLLRPRIFLFPAVLGILVLIVMWTRLMPTNDRDWQRDLAQLPWAERNGDEVTIHNVRDFIYRTETDFDVRYVTKTVRLSELSSLDLFCSYWSGRNIAHVFLSFGFADRDFISFSVEVRKTKDQPYSTIAGFFRNYELIYVAAEERDVVGLRTIYRQPNEQVHIFRLRFYKENAIRLFLNYITKMNALLEKPEFYNTLTTNCTTQVLANAQGEGSRFKYDWRLLASGHTPEYLCEMGSLDSQYSVDDLMAKGLVNPRAQDVTDAQQFSIRIREGVPRPERFMRPPA